MERNRWETAIRCLEIALHPNTKDDEIIAGVNGFRRTADGTPLSKVCAEFAGNFHAGSLNDRHDPVADPIGWRQKFDRLSRENLDLRRKLEAEKAREVVAVRHLHETERRARDSSEELRAAQRRANEAEQRLAEFRSAYTRISDDLKHENFDLRWALEEARRTIAELRAEKAAPPFQNFVAAARLRADQAPTAMTAPRTMPDRRGEGGNLPSFGPTPHSPWTA